MEKIQVVSGEIQIQVHLTPNLSYPSSTFCFYRRGKETSVVLERDGTGGSGDNAADAKSSFQVRFGTCLAAVSIF